MVSPRGPRFGFIQVETVEDAQFSAGDRSGNTHTCAADSGGPVFLRRQGEDALLGLLASSAGACTQGAFLNFFVSVPHYRDWIDRNVLSLRNGQPAGTDTIEVPLPAADRRKK